MKPLTLTVLALFSLASCTTTQSPTKAKTMKTPTLVLTAFGTSVPKARKVFDFIDQKARERFANHDVRWAFTSSFIRKKLKKTGIVTYSLAEVIEQLRNDGVTDIVIQSLHIAPGQEYKDIHKVDVTGLKTAVGTALLTSDADMKAVLNALKRSIKPGMPNILAGHGNDHHPEYNKELVAFDNLLRAAHPGSMLCTVEGQPGTDALRTMGKPAAVNFIPVMIVAGDHVMNDVMGDEEDSWKTIIGAKEVTCAKPLGYNEAVLAVFFNHAETAMNQLNGK